MQVNPMAGGASNAAAPQNSSSAASAASVDYNAFLRLLIAQMKNQDPTNPTDPTQYMAQLASFSNVEQTMQINTKLQALLSSSALSQADGLIGRTVSTADGSITGKVTGFTTAQGKPIAILEDGTRLLISDGVIVSNAPAAP